MIRTATEKSLHLNLMPRDINVSNVVENKKPPLQSPPCLKEGGPSQTVGGFRRGTTEGGGGIQKRDLFHRKRIPQSTALTAPFRQGGL